MPTYKIDKTGDKKRNEKTESRFGGKEERGKKMKKKRHNESYK